MTKLVWLQKVYFRRVVTVVTVVVMLQVISFAEMQEHLAKQRNNMHGTD